MRPYRRRLRIREVTRQHVLGVVALAVVLGLCLSIGLAPVVVPTVSVMGPYEALRSAIVVAGVAYVGLVISLVR